jgi:hypothetical protein
MTDKTWKSEDDTVEKADRNSYPPDDNDDAGGISNRPLSEEIENQDALPERGEMQKDERSRPVEDTQDVER